MRLQRLDLIRYGKFAETVLDFGSRPAGPDVTVVYGPNEAGKSTAYNAWLDFLFGLPLRDHPHAFRFDRKDLMVGAVIDTGQEVLTLRRTGSTKDSLTDDQSHSIAEGRLTALLHGLNRQSYRTRFSLNDQILRDGGAEIAAAQGDLGRLLHAGTSGLSGVTAELEAIEAEIEGFHKKGGRATMLAKAKKEIAEIEARMKAARLEPMAFDRLRQAVTQANIDVAEARAARDAAERAVQTRRAADMWRDLSQQIVQLDDTLALAPQGPDLPAGATARIAAAEADRETAELSLDKARRSALAAQAALDETPSDTVGLRIAAILSTLQAATFDDGEALLPRVLTAGTDIDKRRAEHAAMTAQMDQLAAHIGGEGGTAATVMLSRSVLLRVQKAAQAVRDAKRHLADLTQTRDAATARLGELQPLPAGAAALGDALAVLDRLADDPATLLDQACTMRRQAEAAAAGLPAGWCDLVAAGLPEDASLTSLGAAQERFQLGFDAALRACNDAAEQLARLEAQEQAVQAQEAVVTDTDIAGSRDKRDAAWTLHRTKMDTATADDFAAQMQADDALRSQYAVQTADRLAYRQRQMTLADSAATAARRKADLEQAQDARAAGQQQIAGLAQRLGLSPGSDIASLRERRDALIHAARAAVEAQSALDRSNAAQKQIADAEQGVAAAMQKLEVTTGDEALIPAARRTNAKLDEQAAALRAQSMARASLDALTDEVEQAAGRLKDAQGALDQTCASLWCSDIEAEAILDAVPELTDLAALGVKRDDLSQRIARMSAALDSFKSLAPDLSTLLELSPAPGPAQLMAAARQRADAAQSVAQQISTWTKALSDAKAEQDAQAATLARAAATVTQTLCGQSLADDMPPSAAVMVLTQRDTDRSTRLRLQKERERLAVDHDPEALTAEAAQIDPARTPALLAERQEAEDMLHAAIDRRGQAEADLRHALGKTGAAQLDQDRATALEALADAAQTHGAQLLGLMAARTALRRFRQDRRGAMLEATEAAFSRITGGEWSKLDTQQMGKTERLVGLRGLDPVAADAMSTGTRGQLYLALRIAGHADFVAQHGPLPFVTDDIHETFDDDRAQAAIALAGDMGLRGQVILLTHHRHLVDLAQQAIPQVRVIEMPMSDGTARAQS